MDERAERIKAMKAEQALVESQRTAFETIIACYDPEFNLQSPATRCHGSVKDGLTPTKRVTAMFDGWNIRHIPVEILLLGH